MANLRKVDELEGPPIVGEDYLVLSIEIRGFNLPVFGASHIDHWLPRIAHYHLDRRFLPEEIVSGYSARAKGPFGIINPFAPSWNQKMQNFIFDADREPAEYRRFTCLRDLPLWVGSALPSLSPDDTCAKARWRDGKPYCPHQGVPLAQFWDGEAEIIRCPVHGQLVEMLT
ncbi:MAG: hypothetical protein CFE32_17750 [Alphaproteobacteria bacterium PA3]|nr:MAG: hypothetical protein CFE32_17750 [Alphaproteobacteria bacterium PA3]